MVGIKIPRRCSFTPSQPVAIMAGAAMLALSPPARAVQFVYADPEVIAEQRVAQAGLEPPLRLSQAMSAPETWQQPPPRTDSTPPADAYGLQPSRRIDLPGERLSGSSKAEVPAPLPDAETDSPGPSPVTPRSEADSRNREQAVPRVSWAIPPIRWGGTQGYSLQRSSASGGASTVSQSLFSSFNAASYIYAPWAATVSGRFGMTTSTSRSSAGGNSGVGGGQDNQNRSSNLVGGGDLNVFPTSRFPFQAYFDRSDTRASGNLVSNDYVNTRVGLRQTYRAEDGVTSAGGQIDHSVVNSNNGNNDTLTALSGNFATDIGIVKNSFNGRYSLGERSGSGERARLIGLNTAHNANLDDNLNLSGSFNYLDNAIRSSNGLGSSADSRTRFILLSGFGTWMPEFEDTDELPLTLSGSLRYSTMRNSFGGFGIDTQSVGANANALYRFSNNLTTGINAAVNQVSTAGSPNIFLTMLGANVNYVGNPLMFGNFSYNWNAGGNGNWQSASVEIPSNYFVGLQVGHSVSRFLALSDRETLSLSLSQGVSANQNQTVGNSTSLTHSAAASYGLRWGEQVTGASTLTLSDILTSGASALHYRMLNLGFNGLAQLSPLSSANVNLQFNWNQQSTDNQQAFGFPTISDKSEHMTLIGSASYTHTKFLGYRGLRYSLLFTADTRLRDERLLGNINGEIDRARWTLANRFDYRIGLLDFRLNLAINDVGGKKNALLFFQVTRQIGAF